MKRLLNTLFVTTQGSYLSRKGDTVVVRFEKETRLRVPIHTLGGIVCFGRVSCSPFLMGLCGQTNVSLVFLTESGRFLARIHGPVNGNVLLRRRQYRNADKPSICALAARSMVTAKVANSRNVLLRAVRDQGDDSGHPQIKGAITRLAMLLDELKTMLTVDAVRAKEGEAAKAYFGVFDHLITGDKEAFFFQGRTRRPPLDNVNALLSFLYVLLAGDVESALETVGLDPAVGFLHTDRPGRAGLALDIMEELRPYLADRLALSLINRQQIKPQGFRKTESGAVEMDDDTRKTVLVEWQKRKQHEITHPFSDEKVSLGLLPHMQAMLMARFVRGDLDGYPPFLWR